APHELGGLGVEVVELPLADRDHMARNVLVGFRGPEWSAPPLAGLVLLAHLDLGLGRDLFGHGPAFDRGRLHATHITQIPTGFRAFRPALSAVPTGCQRTARCD